MGCLGGLILEYGPVLFSVVLFADFYDTGELYRKFSREPLIPVLCLLPLQGWIEAWNAPPF